MTIAELVRNRPFTAKPAAYSPFVWRAKVRKYSYAPFWTETFGAPDDSEDLLVNVVAVTRGWFDKYLGCLSLDDCLAQAGSFFYDHAAQEVFIHFAHEAAPYCDPTEYGFAFGLSRHEVVYIDDYEYLPLIESVPNLEQAADAIGATAPTLVSGSAVLRNVAHVDPDTGKTEGMLDFLVGEAVYGNDFFIYQYDPDTGTKTRVACLYIEDYSPGLQKATLNLQDKRKALNAKIPVDTFTQARYPDIEDSLVGKPIPVMYGPVAAVECQAVNPKLLPNSDSVIAVYRMPDGTSDVGSVFVEDENVWKAATGIVADYDSGLLSVANGRSKNGNTLRLKLTDCKGFMFSGHCYPRDVIPHLLARYMGIAFTRSNFDTDEWSVELGGSLVAADIGFVLSEQQEILEVLQDIGSGSKHLFRVEVKPDGRMTARVKDIAREPSLVLDSVDLRNAQELEPETDSTGVYSSVEVKFAHNYVDDVDLSVKNSTFAARVASRFRQSNPLDEPTLLVSQSDAAARALSYARELSEIPQVVPLEVFGHPELRIFDVVTVALQPDSLDPAGREFFGVRDCLILSVDPDPETGINKCSALVIEDPAEASSVESIGSTAFSTTTRAKTPSEVTIGTIHTQLGVDPADGPGPTTPPALSGRAHARTLTLSWTRPAGCSALALEYEYQISRDGAAWYERGAGAWNGDLDAATGVGQATGVTIADLPLGGTEDAPTDQAYQFRVRAFVGSARSPWSNIVELAVGPHSAGDLAAQGVTRAKVEAGFLDELESTISEIWPFGTEHPSKLAILEPNSYDAMAMVEELMHAVADSEEGINIAMRVVDGNVTRIASLQFDVDGLRSAVADFLETTGGQQVDLTLLSQTAEKVRTMALSGTYVDGSETLDTWEKAQIDVLADQIAQVVEARDGGGWQVASSIITTESIADRVAQVIINDAGVEAAISSIVQTASGITLAVEALKGEAIEMIDDALAEANAGIQVQANRISIGVQAIADNNDVLIGLITVQADRITSEVSRASSSESGIDTTLRGLIDIQADRITSEVSRSQGAETTLASQIIQTAEAINLAVWGQSSIPGGPSISSQLALQADEIALQVQAGAHDAFLALSLTLPPALTAAQYAALRDGCEASVDAVYQEQTGSGMFYIKTTATREQILAARNALISAGRVASQIALHADDILLDGSVNIRHLNTDSAFIEAIEGLHLQVDSADIAGKLTASQIDVDDLKAASGLFQNIEVTGKATLSECVLSNVTAGDNIARRSDSDSTKTAPNYLSKLKELQFGAGGAIRVYWEFFNNFVGCDSALFVNGSQVGASVSHSGSASAPQAVSRDISINAGDLVQVYATCPSGGYTTTVRNLRISIAERPGILALLGNP